MSRAARVVVVCTGNAARSVMAGYFLGHLAECDGRPLELRTAGTHALEGQPMGMRTRDAMLGLGDLDHLPLSKHRSHQLTEEDVAWADLVVVMEADHLRYVRRVHPAGAPRTATMVRVAATLPSDDRPLPARIASLDLAAVDAEGEVEVPDPAGGDAATYDRCARALFALSTSLVERL